MGEHDRKPGPGPGITRRDFLDGVAQIVGSIAATSMIGGAVAPAVADDAEAVPAADTTPDPPLRQGMRGFDDAAMEAGHALRDGLRLGAITDTGEHYDLVVVGAGMSGLSAAWFYRRQRPGARILLLDGCDDFGGHARRVEFDVDGRKLLVCGGTEALWNMNTFSPESVELLEGIGIDRARYATHVARDPNPMRDLGLGSAIFYDEETFGADRLVLGRPPLQGTSAEQWQAYFDRTPMSAEIRQGFIRLYTDRADHFAGMSLAEKRRRLEGMSYAAYLRDVVRVHPDTVAYIVRSGSGDADNQSAGPETYSAWYAWRRNQRGFDGLGLPRSDRLSNLAETPGETIAFPDGVAGVARLLVRALVPTALPGSTAEDSIAARMDYAKLDEPGNTVRIRLSSTVARVSHVGEPDSASAVEVTYVRRGESMRVRAGAVVMACFNAMVPHLVPELPEPQKAALRMAVRKPLVRSFVAIRRWTAFRNLGIRDVSCPGMYHQYIAPWFRPEWGGAYANARSPEEPVILYLRLSNRILEMQGSGLPPREQWKAARAQLQAIRFETIEANIRAQLDRVLGPGGFDAEHDIAGITVCRWSHGYAGGSNALFDPDWTQRTDAPWVVGRRRHGRIAIANSDAAATSLTNAAFAQGHRAVMEIINDVERPVYDYRWSERDTAAMPGPDRGTDA